MQLRVWCVVVERGYGHTAETTATIEAGSFACQCCVLVLGIGIAIQ